jgi:hypothetical protein
MELLPANRRFLHRKLACRKLAINYVGMPEIKNNIILFYLKSKRNLGIEGVTCCSKELCPVYASEIK